MINCDKVCYQMIKIRKRNLILKLTIRKNPRCFKYSRKNKKSKIQKPFKFKTLINKFFQSFNYQK